MPEQGYEFDRQSAERIAKTVRRMESQLRPDGRGIVGDRAGNDRRIFVKVTSLTTTSGLYPGIQVASTQATPSDPQTPQTNTNYPPGYVVPAAASNGFQPFGTGTQDCWIQFNAPLIPTLNNVYPATPAALRAADGKAIYQASDPGRRTGWVKVTSSTSLSLGMLGGGSLTVYPALVSTLAGGTWTDSGQTYFYHPNGITPSVGDRYYCDYLGTDSSGAYPVFGMGEAAPFTWSSQATLAASYTCTATMSATGLSITLPYTGTYLLVAEVNGNLNIFPKASPNLSPTQINAQLYDGNAAALIGKPGVPVSFLQTLWTSPISSNLPGTAVVAFLYQNTTINNVISLYADVDNLQAGSAVILSAVLDVYLFSPGALPSATTVNGQTGGVNIVPAGNATQTPGGVGTVVNTTSGNISLGLTSSALAGISLSLALGNL